MKKVMIIVVWLIVFLFMLTAMCSLLTESSTMANVVGFIGLVSTITLSITTKCFTSITIKPNKKNENNEK